ncbi:hypothetical protein [Proteus mirabilis]|nr:hypothetical protein [Proteus mirabilis]
MVIVLVTNGDKLQHIVFIANGQFDRLKSDCQYLAVSLCCNLISQRR